MGALNLYLYCKMRDIQIPYTRLKTACTRLQTGTGRVGREQPCHFHGAVAVLAPSRSQPRL